MIRFRRISTRLSALYGGLFALALAAIGGVSHVLLSRHVENVAAEELETSAAVFARIWEFRTRALVDVAEILARDYGFREAVATGDSPTIESALANARERVGGGQAFTVFNSGEIVGSGHPAVKAAAAQLPFRLDPARRSAVVEAGGGVYHMVVASVRAPVEVGWVVFALPVDAADLRSLERLSAVPLTANVLRGQPGGWNAATTSRSVLRGVPEGRATLADLNGERSFALIKPLPGASRTPEAALLLSYRRSDAMAPFRALRLSVLTIGLLGLALVIFGSVRLARSIARPIAALDTAARSVEQGSYQAVAVSGADEIGRLATSFNAMAQGIAERESRIAHLAFHDTLTGLPNRVLFREQTDAAIRQVKHQGSVAAVLCVDLDHFRQVNDTLGHQVGDAMLKQVTGIMASWTGDALLARLGGDEFGVLLVTSDRDRPRTLAQKLVDRLGEPMTVGAHRIVGGASIGIAVAPVDGSTADALLKHADLALHRAKDDGRARLRFFESALDAEAQARRQLELDMREAIGGGQFRLEFQPLLSLTDDRICTFEALLRWDHPTRGLISPAEFIPIAEDTGLIVPIGEFVVQEACRVAVTWPRHVGVAVNVSSLQFKSPALHGVIVQALARTGLEPHRLEIEMTESIFVENSGATLKLLHSLRSLGIRVALDDFGTGYSSLAYLRRFPFDKIKIDRSFVTDMGDDVQAAPIVGAIVELARALGMHVTAEGVESKRQLELLRTLGCGSIQGYLFSKPLSADAALALIRDDADAGKAA